MKHYLTLALLLPTDVASGVYVVRTGTKALRLMGGVSSSRMDKQKPPAVWSGAFAYLIWRV